MSKVTFGTGPFNEGQVYLGSNGVNYVYESGCFNLSKPADIDTVDGYSEQDESDGSQLDAQGNPIPAGHAITTYYDANGAVVNSRDDEKTQGSTTTPSADGLGQVITTSDNETTFVCDKQFKGLRENSDGTKTEIFVDQSGVESTGLTLEEPTQSGEPQLGVVDAAGNTTYFDANGITQPIPAVDVNGDPVYPSQAVWNFIDGDGNYLGSKPCKDETVLAQTPNGTELPFSGLNQVITQCCTWTSTVDVDGNITTPTGVVVAAVDGNGNAYPAGTEVQSETDVNGVYTVSCEKQESTGYSQISVTAAGDVDGAGNAIVYIDQEGNPIAVGTVADHKFDSKGNYLGSWVSSGGTEVTLTPNANATATLEVGGESCPVSTLELRLCNAAPRAKGDKLNIMTVEERVASGMGNYHPFIDSGDGCTPANRTSCLKEPAITINPECHIYTSAAGAAGWTRCISNQIARALGGVPANDVDTYSAANLNAASVGSTIYSPEVEITLTNNFVCSPLVTEIWLNTNGIRSIGAFPAGWVFEITHEIERVEPFPTGWNSQDAGYLSTLNASDYLHGAIFSYHSTSRTVQPGLSLIQKSRLCLEVLVKGDPVPAASGLSIASHGGYIIGDIPYV